MIKVKNKQYKIIDAHLHLPWQDEYSTIEKKLERLQKEMRNNDIDKMPRTLVTSVVS